MTLPPPPPEPEPGPPSGGTAPPASGRHRGSGWQPGQLGIAAIAAGVLAIFGVGAVVLPALFSGREGAPPAIAAPAVEGPAPETAPSSEEATVPPASPTGEASAKATVKPSATVAGNARFEDEVLALVNAERRKARCEPVRAEAKLRSAARAHSADMAAQDFFSHTGSDGSSFSDRARRAGYSAAMSENIAKGQKSPQDVMKSWMRSDGHRKNMLDCDAKALGVGVVMRGRTPLWTQNFGRA